MVMQVADIWSTSNVQPNTTEASGSGTVSAAAATTSKALLEAQQKLHISQQQVWRTGTASLHVLASFAVWAGILRTIPVCQRCHFQAVWATNKCCFKFDAALAFQSCNKYAAHVQQQRSSLWDHSASVMHINLGCTAEGYCCSARSCTTLQARRIWEAVLYAQPKVRTDEGLATLAQLVSPVAFTLCSVSVSCFDVKRTCSSIRVSNGL